MVKRPWTTYRGSGDRPVHMAWADPTNPAADGDMADRPSGTCIRPTSVGQLAHQVVAERSWGALS